MRIIKKACLETLGFIVSTSPTAKGKSASIVISEFDHIPIKDMGEGVVNILGLIVNLCVAKHKIFIIEEMENDIHPKALKGVLSLIEKKSDTNQFLISTHSNIVTKYLGSLPGAKMFNVSSTFSHESRIPISKVEEIGESVLDRRKILEELGYELYDNDLWKAWLFLEESSAETVIKDFLMPVFVPQLFGKMKTFSANGVDSIEPKFTDFNKLFVFLHLEPQYKNRVWVLIDGGVREKGIIDDFKKKYVEGNNWNEKNFSQFSQHCFEKYYPDIFTKDVAAIDLLKDKKARKKAKEELLLKVKQWWEENPDLAKTEFQKSAAEVIDILKEIANYI